MAEDLIKLFGELMAGLQAPRSMPIKILGAAIEPWDKIRDELGCFGWMTAEDHERLLRKGLEETPEDGEIDVQDLIADEVVSINSSEVEADLQLVTEAQALTEENKELRQVMKRITEQESPKDMYDLAMENLPKE